MCGHLQHQGEEKLDGICAIFVKHDFRDMVVGGFCVFAIDCEDALFGDIGRWIGQMRGQKGRIHF